MVRLASTAVLFALATTVASAQAPQNTQQNAQRKPAPPRRYFQPCRQTA